MTFWVIINLMDIKCTQCGAGVEISEDSGFISCPYCDSRLYIESDRTVRHFYLKPEVKPNEIASIISKELFSRELKAEVAVVSADPVFIPFWLVRLKQGEMRFPAAELANPELQNCAIPAGKLVPYEPELEKKYKVEMPSLSLDELKKKPALEKAVNHIERTDLIHLPFYRVSYNYGNETFQAMVDAGEGKLYAEKLPRGLSREKDRYFLGLFAVLSLGFLLEAFFIPGFWFVLLAYAATGVLAWYLVRKALEQKGY